MARIDSMETKVHGRQRKADMVWSMDSSSIPADGGAEEARFGVLYTPVMLAKGTVQGAQWTGCVTSIALAALESGMVDAVVCIANENGGTWSSPEPIIAKTTQEVLKGRGVKPALAPSLRVLDRIKADSSIRKLLFCGVGCAVQGT
jgi:coenzyme F420-reducing hydrogenase beta subunit